MNAVETRARPLRMVRGAAGKVAYGTLQRLLGFWLVWHLGGGMKALQTKGISTRTLWKNQADFTKFMGAPVADFKFHPDDVEALVAVLRAHTDPKQKRRII